MVLPRPFGPTRTKLRASRMKPSVRACSMTSRSIFLGQPHSKSAMTLNFLMLDLRSRRSKLRRERSWASSWASCSSSMRGDQCALVARARKSSRLAGMVFSPICLSWAGRSFVGLMLLVGELIIGLQVVRGNLEGLHFRMAAEIHGRGRGALLRALPSAEDERYGRSAWRIALESFLNGAAQFGRTIAVQELDQLGSLISGRFSPRESGIQQSLTFRYRFGQATAGSRSSSLAFFFQ